MINKEIRSSERPTPEAYELKAPSPVEIYDSLRLDGEEELDRPLDRTFYTGLGGGLAMIISFIAVSALHAHVPDSQWKLLLVSLGYPIGFIVVILGRQGLITEEAVLGMLPFLSTPHKYSFGSVLRLWGTVLCGNVVTILLMSFFLSMTNAISPELKHAATELGKIAAEPAAGALLLKAILAGWIIALALWATPSAEGGKVFVIYLLAFIVGILHFAHIATGTAEVSFAVFEGALPATALLSFVAIVAVGNVLGGAVLVAMLSHAQIPKLPHRREAS